MAASASLTRSYATFTTDRFASVGEDDSWISGGDLIAWLISRLQPLPLEIGEPIQEDYGWGFWAKSGKDTFWVYAALYPNPRAGWAEEEYEAEEPRPAPASKVEVIAPDGPAQWGLAAAYDGGRYVLRRLFHRPDPTLLPKLCEAIDRALRSEPGIQGLRWWSTGFEEGTSGEHPTGG
jgi:hypothetical protein